MTFNFRVKIKGIDETIRNLDSIGRAKIPAALKKGLIRSSTYVKAELKKNVPVDTGNLRKSVQSKVNISSLTAEIGPDPSIADYAYWVEFGHHTRSGSFVHGQHFMQNTKNETAPEIQRIFDEEIEKALN